PGEDNDRGSFWSIWSDGAGDEERNSPDAGVREEADAGSTPAPPSPSAAPSAIKAAVKKPRQQSSDTWMVGSEKIDVELTQEINQQRAAWARLQKYARERSSTVDVWTHVDAAHLGGSSSRWEAAVGYVC
ncbi:unnamed protein product, partial [Ectocarpus sp. 6 AP-2014]